MKQRRVKARLVGGTKRFFPLSLPVLVYDQVSREADAKNMSMNLLINRWIDDYLAKERVHPSQQLENKIHSRL